MAKSIVKVPSAEAQGLDFLAFSFNGKHSWDDFHIYRVINGDRYEENLSPTLTDKTAEVPGGDGMYYFGTTHKQKEFNISFAFDHLKETELKELKKWLNGKEMGDLWFSEAPYKVWSAKPTGNSSIKYIPFDELDEQGNIIRIYKGEGSVQFTAYWPYAHTPDKIQKKITESWEDVGDGKYLSSYNDFVNKNEWSVASGLFNTHTPGDNNGDLPTPFVLKQDGFIPSGTVFAVGEAEITTTSDCYNLEWDSKTGLVLAGNSATVIDKKDKKPINVLGGACATIPVGGTSIINGEIDNAITRTTIEVDKFYSEWEEVSRVQGVTELVTEQTEIIETKTNTYTGWYIGNTSEFGDELPWEDGINMNMEELEAVGLSIQDISYSRLGTQCESELLTISFSEEYMFNIQQHTFSQQEYEKEEETNTEEQIISEGEISQQRQSQQIKKLGSGQITTTVDYSIPINKTSLSLKIYNEYKKQALKIILRNDETLLFTIPKFDIDFTGPNTTEDEYGIIKATSAWPLTASDGKGNAFTLYAEIETTLDPNSQELHAYLRLKQLQSSESENEIPFVLCPHTITNSFAIGPKEGAQESSEVTVYEEIVITEIQTKTTPINVEYTREITDVITTTKTEIIEYTGQFSCTNPQLTIVLTTTSTTKNQAGVITNEVENKQETNTNPSQLNINYHYWYY